MIYLYAIVEPSLQTIPDAIGLADQPLQMRRIPDLCAYLTEHSAPQPPPTAQNVWRHEQVIEQLMRSHTLLPVRFGTVFGSDEALLESLQRNHDSLRAGLSRVRGCVELGVRAMWEPGPVGRVAPVGSGLEYMRRRGEQERLRQSQESRACELADAIHAPLAELAIQSTRRVLDTPRFVLSGAYLVHRDQVDPFCERARELAAGVPDLRTLCTGPWPPYHFVPALEPESCHA